MRVLRRRREQTFIRSFILEKRSRCSINEICSSENAFTPKVEGKMSLKTESSGYI
jgi:hypothetical protein